MFYFLSRPSRTKVMVVWTLLGIFHTAKSNSEQPKPKCHHDLSILISALIWWRNVVLKQSSFALDHWKLWLKIAGDEGEIWPSGLWCTKESEYIFVLIIKFSVFMDGEFRGDWNEKLPLNLAKIYHLLIRQVNTLRIKFCNVHTAWLATGRFRN